MQEVSTISLKLQEKFEEIFISKISLLKKMLQEGELLEVERLFGQDLREFYDVMMSFLLTEVGSSEAFKNILSDHYSSHEIGDLRLRETRVQLQTGSWVNYKSYYARSISANSDLPTRHLSKVYWSCLGKTGLKYAGLVSAYSVICPSFEVGQKLLSEHEISANASQMRELSLKLGDISVKQGEEILLTELEKEHGLADKRVVIALDGGRSRIRQPNGEVSNKGYECYETPWNEPKIIVIHVLDEQGALNKKEELPLYFGTMKCLKKTFIKRLKIKE